jgi:large subunit ribosomal protein L31
MQKKIHPKCNSNIIKCVCGKSYYTESTKKYKIDICSSCHPFFIGKESFVDTEGRIERFKRKYRRK